jgi:hypothetical protein
MIWTLGDLAGLPLETHIRTADGKELYLVHEFGSYFWVKDPSKPGVLYSALVSWLPVEVL